HTETETALQLVCSLYPLWVVRGRTLEGLTWFDSIQLSTKIVEVSPAIRARALADNAAIRAYADTSYGTGQAEEALAIARELDDPALIARALTSCVITAMWDAEVALSYISEAIDVARELDDKWRLSQ